MRFSASDLTIDILGFWAHSAVGPTTSFRVLHRESSVLLDVGCDPIGRLRQNGINPTTVTTVFVSHMHSDHVSGLANFIFTRQLLGRSIQLSSLQVIGGADVLGNARRLVELQYPERQFDVDWTPIPVAMPHEIGSGMSISLFNNKHTVPCYGAHLIANNQNLVFTSDTAPVDAHRDLTDSCDILIGEAFGLAADVGESIHDRGHSTAEDLANLATSINARYIIPFHFDEKYESEIRRQELLSACAPNPTAAVIDPVTGNIL